MPQLTEFTDEELETVEETTMERLWGLTEMIPESAYSVTNTTYAGGKAIVKFVRSSIWIVSTSLIVLALPAALEAERVNMEISREQEQRQALFGAQQPPM
eukprot:scpid94796/ scgid8119/ 